MRGESGAPDIDQSKLQPSATPCANGSFGEGTSAEARDGLSNVVVMLGVWGTETDADAETETGRSHLNCKETEWTNRRGNCEGKRTDGQLTDGVMRRIGPISVPLNMLSMKLPLVTIMLFVS